MMMVVAVTMRVMNKMMIVVMKNMAVAVGVMVVMTVFTMTMWTILSITGYPDNMVFAEFRRRFDVLAPHLTKKLGRNFIVKDEKRVSPSEHTAFIQGALGRRPQSRPAWAFTPRGVEQTILSNAT